MNQILLYLGSALPIIWGIAHLFPTRSVVKDFGDISTDNKHIITMEWIVEGVTLIFKGLLCGAVTYLDFTYYLENFIYISCAIFLIVLAIVSLFTGFKVNFLPYKLCPVIFTLSAILLILGIYL